MSDNEDLLSRLNAHGQQFLSSFAVPADYKKKRKHVEELTKPRKIAKVEIEVEESEEEWGGIVESGDSEDDTGADDFEHEDDEFAAETVIEQRAPVVVFSDNSAAASTLVPATKAQMKAFMSSKVSKIRETVTEAEAALTGEEVEEERSLAQNDAMLHRLVHTKLLSGSLGPELDLTPAQRRKALAGRVLEVAGGAKLGKGEKSVRQTEKNKAAQRVRLGMVDKQKQRDDHELDEAKNMGNYHPTIKKLFEANASSGPGLKKRDRGLKMGVGHFSGGMLRLSRDEIDTAQGTRGRGGSRGRGASRGRGRGGPPMRGLSNPDRGRGAPRGRGKSSGGAGRGRGH